MAAHWCKAVVEQVVPKINTIPPPPPPPPQIVVPTSSKFQQYGMPAPVSSSPLSKFMTQGLSSNTIGTGNVAHHMNSSSAVSAATMSQYDQCYAQMYGTTNYSLSSAPTAPPMTYSQIVQKSAAPPTTQSATLSQTIQSLPKKPKVSRFQPAPAATPGAGDIIATPAPVAEINPVVRAPVIPKTTTSSWPPSLKQYIDKCFANCTSDAEKKQTTDILQKLISKVSAEGRLAVHKWELENTSLVSKPAATSASASATELSMSSMQMQPSLVAQGTAAGAKKRKNRWDATSGATENGANNGMDQNGFIAFSTASNPATSAAATAAGSSGVIKKSKGGILALSASLVTSDKEKEMRNRRMDRFKDDSSDVSISEIPNMAIGGGGRSVSVVGKGKLTNNGKKNKKQVAAATLHNYQNNNNVGGGEFDLDSLRIVGTSQKIEKDYFRLTSAPDPSTVRPEPILRQSLSLLKKKWQQGVLEYLPMCSQLKAIRQDLTVQHIQNEFTVNVYETHARVALECVDLNEYNQCQTQLKQLYAKGHRGSEAEFAAYRILYYSYLLGNKKYQSGSSDLAFLMAELSLRKDLSRDPAIQHALQVRKAVQSNNYHRFFQLYSTAPNMGGSILDLMLDSWRLLALQRMCKSYKPTLEVDFVLETLALEKNSEASLKFLRKAGCVLISTNREIDTKETVIDMAVVFNDENLLL